MTIKHYMMKLALCSQYWKYIWKTVRGTYIAFQLSGRTA